ncbi:tripartite tricarboxylate transporter substrate binding protein [Ramlibacter sp. XY19]|uniref:Bug family tripartite tricarboxylate transporter substrate binding protein n=1 Tax=Ramlibacter paludis TaxID=2908000 RepID=UPI0023DC9821|nr:tripartite tricarboxylate transporter substrate binding protein [Ramlibacter paludis]MCG2593913.1 tripartite tricarboxylate transporter substrate binding protein [Ramlibacter paludis]
MTTELSRRALLLAGAAAALPALAQPLYATRPIKLVVPYPPGGTADAIARALADRLKEQVGQPVIVDNKAGASGTIGMDAVAKAAPDGYTLAFSAISPLVLSPYLGKVPYDPDNDLTPVVSVMYSPVLLLATPASGARDFRDLMGGARDRPKSVRWATSGNGSLGHLMFEQLALQSKVQMVHVPYKGGGQQLTDALSGQFEVLSINAGPTLTEHIKSGRLRPLAVGAPKRLDSLPTVPTLAELGYPKANLSSQFGVFAPAKLPERLLDRIHGEIVTAMQHPDVRNRMIASDNVPTGGSVKEFAREIAAESAENSRLIKSAGIKGD